jgi:hypothetical protein
MFISKIKAKPGCILVLKLRILGWIHKKALMMNDYAYFYLVDNLVECRPGWVG